MKWQASLEEQHLRTAKMEEPLIPEAASPYHPKLRSYLLGQCFNVARVSIWWTSLSPLILSVTGQDEAIGATRTAFNIAALVLSPIAGAWAQSQDVASVLKASNAVRGLVWAIALPVAWIFGSVVFESTTLTVTLYFACVTFLTILAVCSVGPPFCR